MKHVFATIAVTLLASAAFAQTTSGPMSSPSSEAMGTSPKTGTMGNDTMAKDKMATDDMAMTQKNGKWYMGDRRATTAEIAAHKKMMMSKPS